MKVIFCSNYFTHHQMQLSEELNRLTDNMYSFIGYKEMDEERKRLGWNMKDIPAYVYQGHSTLENHQVYESDVLIEGSFPQNLLERFLKSTKVHFIYSERLLKDRDSLLKYPIRYIRWHRKYTSDKPTFLLSAGAYAVSDFNKYGLFRKKSYKWGYFPQRYIYDDINSLMEKKKHHKLLWCGRFIDWKHPDDVIWLAAELRKSNISFSIEMIGTGPMKAEICNLIEEYHLDDYVRITDPMTPIEIREKMKETGIYLFTSDQHEGWGAVVNEAMNSGCAVIGSHLAGSVPYLIKDKDNGLIYHSQDRKQLFKKTVYLLENTDEQSRLGLAAYHTIVSEWNANVAAERLLNISNHILAGEKFPVLYDSGPCSPAISCC